MTDTKHVVSAPLRWRCSDWLKAGGITGFTLGLYFCDQNIKDFTQNHRNSFTGKIAKVFTTAGEPKIVLPVLAITYLYGHLSDNSRVRRTSLMSLESMIISSLFTQTIKLTTHRHRPNTGDPYSSWDGPKSTFSHQSFPSGHATTAFALATTIASEYDQNVVIPTLSYTAATLTALARVHDNDHWTSDVFLGSIIGHVVALTIFHINKDENNTADKLFYTGPEYKLIIPLYRF